MTTPHLLTDIENGILTITLNRPEKLNAYTSQMGRELIAAIDLANRDDDIRVVIVTGAGRGFCAGADISDTGYFKEPEADHEREVNGGFPLKIYECLKPVIAAINGPAVGVGITMTLPMDIRIAAEGARFGFVFTRRGLLPEAGSAWFLPRIVGLPKSLEWVYTGKMIDAAEALSTGLVNEVVAPDRLLARAHEIARVIADNSSAVATSLSRQLMWRASAADHPMAALSVDAALNRQLAASGDVKEGIAAFREKRQARFRDKPSSDMPGLYPWWQI